MDIFNYFPQKIKEVILSNLKVEMYKYIEEIRLRNTNNIIIKLTNKDVVINYKVTSEDLIETISLISENSIYSYQNQICNGYITVKGGHRVGITGNVAFENNEVININYIYSLNFRVAKEVIGCSDDIIKYIINYKNDTVFNTLIIGKPASGKTTLLRDIIRNLSSGIDDFEKKNKMFFNVGVVDERSEISSMYKGIPQNNLGDRTDILENIPKTIGMKMLIRSMAPDVIVADEIGGTNDSEAINYVVCSGVKCIFTAHGEIIEDLYKNPELNKLMNSHVIERILILSDKDKGKIKKVHRLDGLRYT